VLEEIGFVVFPIYKKGIKMPDNFDNSDTNETFAFKRLPVSAEEIQAYTQKFFPQKKIKGHFFKRFSVWLIISFLRLLPHWLAYHIGTLIGKGLCFFKTGRHVAFTNLNIVYADTKSMEEKQAIYKASLINFGHVIINYMRLPFAGEKFWTENCELVNEDVLKKAANRKKGVILVGGHIGMWDLAGGKVGMSGYPAAVVSKGINDPVINKIVNDARTAMNMGGIETRNTMDQIFAGLKRGESLVLALDQNMKKGKGAFIDWMGQKACSVKTTAYIVKKSGAAVIPGYMIQQGPKKFKVILNDELSWIDCPEDPEKELALNNQNQADAVQKIILEHPEHWLWIYKRWKVVPDGERNPYKK
jgi:KDO2-lipid IV(A) lauroyltransferase